LHEAAPIVHEDGKGTSRQRALLLAEYVTPMTRHAARQPARKQGNGGSIVRKEQKIDRLSLVLPRYGKIPHPGIGVKPGQSSATSAQLACSRAHEAGKVTCGSEQKAMAERPI
jgi:hypothetical protein